MSKMQSSNTLHATESKRSVKLAEDMLHAGSDYTTKKQNHFKRRINSIQLPKIKQASTDAYKQVVLPEVIRARDLEKKYLKDLTPKAARPELNINTSNDYDAEPPVESRANKGSTNPFMQKQYSGMHEVTVDKVDSPVPTSKRRMNKELGSEQSRISQAKDTISKMGSQGKLAEDEEDPEAALKA